MRQPPIGLRRERRPAVGFTLVELLAIIAIIGILTALLLPALSQAKKRAQGIACLNNLKGLQLCLHFYETDFNDYFVPNSSMAVFTSTSLVNPNFNVTGPSWLPDMYAPMEYDPSNIINGLIYQYNRSVPIYHCPADVSTLTGPTGQPLAKLRWRSYNLSQSVNGDPQAEPTYNGIIPTWEKFSDVRQPRPSDLFAFIDENPLTMTDAKFDNPPVGSTYFFQNEWWDQPSDRHSQGANLSFVDGHVEHWKWVYPKTAKGPGQAVATKEMADFLRVQNAMKQLSDD